MTRGLSTMLAALLLLAAMLCQAGLAMAEDEAAMRERFKARVRRQIEPEEKGIHITTTTPPVMSRDYRDNEIAADAAYKGKWIQIRGRILSVERGPKGGVIVNLAADSYGVQHVRAELFDVQCRFVDGPERFKPLAVMDVAAGLRKWQDVLVEGLGAGAPMGMPTITQAIIWDAAELDEWRQKRQAAQEAEQAQGPQEAPEQ